MFRPGSTGDEICARRSPAVVVSMIALFVAAIGSANAQSAVSAADRQLEQYLTDRELDELLATHLRDRLDSSGSSARIEIAGRLGRLYVSMMDKRPDPETRRRIEDMGRSLLDQVPEAESADLRLSLAKASYLSAEVVAERYRLRMATPQEAEEAQRTMREVGALFQGIGSKANRSVEIFERREEMADERELRIVRVQLADARRIRSLAMYYAGWSSYYVGLLSGIDGHADEALRHFGWLLNSSGGNQANVDRAAEGLLRFEHVARAAMGAALSESLRGNANIAERWLDLIENSSELPETVREQIFTRRLTVLAEARRWSDLNWRLDRYRGRSDDGLLAVREARLGSVYALAALGRLDLPDRARPVLESIARGCLSDLVSSGQVAHVLDLAGQFGTAQLGAHGFIVNYVRGLQSFERARAMHEESGESRDEPSSSEAVRIAYREVSDMIISAVETTDAESFPEQLGNARLVAGLSLYYAGEFELAAALLEAAHASAPSSQQAEEALWLVVVALDKAIESGRTDLADELSRLTTLYLHSYPGGDRAAQLLLRQATSGSMSEERAVEILMGVEPESPLYGSARRHAAQLLYKIYRRAEPADRDFAALQFVTVAEQVLAMDRKLVNSAAKEEAIEAAKRVVGHVRQILDALLRSDGPDLARAEAALQILDGTAAQVGVDLSELESELTYRRLQVAVHRNNEPAIGVLLTRLHLLGGVFSDNADRLVFDRVRRRWSSYPQDAMLARRVVETGYRVMMQFEAGSTARRDVASLYDTVAAAAALLWTVEEDQAMRDIAIDNDRALIDSGHKTAASLRRFAELSDAAGNTQDALDGWRTLLAGVPVDSEMWFEARYQSIRLLSLTDRERAIAVMRQYVLLHPEFGPEPWGSSLRALSIQLEPSEPSEGSGEPNPGSGGGP